MILNARILRTDLTVETKRVTMPRYRKASSAVVTLGTTLRLADPTVAAVRTAETGDHYEWVGRYTPEHMAAINAAPKGW